MKPVAPDMTIRLPRGTAGSSNVRTDVVKSENRERIYDCRGDEVRLVESDKGECNGYPSGLLCGGLGLLYTH